MNFLRYPLIQWLIVLALVSICNSHQCPGLNQVAFADDRAPMYGDDKLYEADVLRRHPISFVGELLEEEEHIPKIIIDDHKDMTTCWKSTCQFMPGLLEMLYECAINAQDPHDDHSDSVKGIWTICPNGTCSLIYSNLKNRAIDFIQLKSVIYGQGRIFVDIKTINTSYIDIDQLKRYYGDGGNDNENDFPEDFDGILTFSINKSNWRWENNFNPYLNISEINFRVDMTENGFDTSGFAAIDKITISFKSTIDYSTHMVMIAISVSIVFVFMIFLVILNCVRWRCGGGDNDYDDSEYDQLEEFEDQNQTAYSASELSQDGFNKIFQNEIEIEQGGGKMTVSSVQFGKKFPTITETSKESIEPTSPTYPLCNSIKRRPFGFDTSLFSGPSGFTFPKFIKKV